MSLKLDKVDIKKIAKELIFICLGCAIYSFAIMHFNVPNKLAEGGGTGISLLLLYAFGLPVSTGTILVNIPLLIIGFKMLDRKTMIYTLYGITMLTAWLKFFEVYNVNIDIGGDKLLASVFGGIIAGIGLGIVFLVGVIIALTFIAVKSFPAILYTLFYIFICTKLIDYVVEGGVSGKGVMIVSPKIEEITKIVQEDMERGLTYFKGQGSYTRKDMNIGYCVVSRNEISRLKSLVFEIDPRAFVTITEVHDVMGEGFSFDQPKKIKVGIKKDK